MRILKQGKLAERKFTCDRCGCVFVADENDKKEISESWMTCDAQAYVVYCPTCEEQIEWYIGNDYNEEK